MKALEVSFHAFIFIDTVDQCFCHLFINENRFYFNQFKRKLKSKKCKRFFIWIEVSTAFVIKIKYIPIYKVLLDFQLIIVLL